MLNKNRADKLMIEIISLILKKIKKPLGIKPPQTELNLYLLKHIPYKRFLSKRKPRVLNPRLCLHGMVKSVRLVQRWEILRIVLTKQATLDQKARSRPKGKASKHKEFPEEH